MRPQYLNLNHHSRGKKNQRSDVLKTWAAKLNMTVFNPPELPTRDESNSSPDVVSASPEFQHQEMTKSMRRIQGLPSDHNLVFWKGKFPTVDSGDRRRDPLGISRPKRFGFSGRTSKTRSIFTMLHIVH